MRRILMFTLFVWSICGFADVLGHMPLTLMTKAKIEADQRHAQQLVQQRWQSHPAYKARHHSNPFP